MTSRSRPRSGRLLLGGLAAVVMLLWVFRGPIVRFGGRLLFPFPFRPEIEREAARAGIDPLLVVSVMREESGFTPKALSRAGAVGLMQLMPHTAQWVAHRLREPVGDLEEPRTNIHLGASYLGYLDRHYDGDLVRVLAAYNGGLGNVQRWHDLSEAYPETRRYVERGLKTYAIYQWLYRPGGHPTATPPSSWVRASTDVVPQPALRRARESL